MTRCLWCVILVLCLFYTSMSYAQSRAEYRDVVMHNARTATSNGSALNVHNSSVVRLDIQITGGATVSFQIAGAGNFAWYSKACFDSTFNAVTSTTSTGIFYCPVAGSNTFQAPVTSYTSGTVTVVGRATTAF